MPNPYVTKTSPTVFSKVNGHFGTYIDFAFLGSREGGQWLRGYVPMNAKTGHVAGASGMTVATGFDIGQRSRNELQYQFRLPSDLIQILLPFVSVHMTSMSKAQVVDRVAKLGPVPILTKSQADILDEAIMYEILDQAVTAWDSIRASGVPRFVSLPSNWQTVWFSRFYQEGSGRQLGMAAAFRSDATAGRWQEAVTDLRNYTQYKDRATKEADFLQTGSPPPQAGSAASDAGTIHAP